MRFHPSGMNGGLTLKAIIGNPLLLAEYWI
jgi:hypothetical protein